jgi:hypothetical protein
MTIPLGDEPDDHTVPTIVMRHSPITDHLNTSIIQDLQQMVHKPLPEPLKDISCIKSSPPAYESTVSFRVHFVSGAEVQVAREAFASPSRYVGPSLRRGLYPYYSSSDYFDCPPPATAPAMSELFFSSFIPRRINPRQTQMSVAPLPPSFSRPCPPNLSYDAFPPIYSIANDNRLDCGFPILPPPSPISPHPFVSHDVNEVDWIRSVL